LTFVETERGRFAVDLNGPADAPVMMLVAGLGDDRSSWTDVVPNLSNTYRCVTFDNRGIGESPITPGPYRIGEMAEDAEQIARALELPVLVAVGSSMGSGICQEWALRYPSRHGALVLSGTWAKADITLDLAFQHWAAVAHAEDSTSLLDAIMLWCLSPAYLEMNPEFVEEFRRVSLPDLDGFRAAAEACRHHDTDDRLQQIRQPVLVVSGSSDILIRPELSRQVADRIADARFVAMDTGHMPFWERPEEWVDLVTSWLEKRVGHRPAG
jgi:3-oxoadipate enol-lactonase